MTKSKLSKFELHNFFLELGSPVRMQILELLAEGLGYRNSELARSVGVSAQESLRHIGRLMDQHLVVQNSREYSLSQIGRILIEGILPQVSFLITNSKFFQLHDFSVIPPILTRRFAELTDCDVIEGPSTILHVAEKIIENATDFIWDIAKLATTNTSRLIASKSGLNIRAIEEKVREGENEFAIPKIVGQERRIIDHIDIGMIMSEKEAYIRFPVFVTGELSLNHALHGKDPNFMKFCHDLFQFYWEQSQSVSDL
jgi:predicted transcriptional regulator